MRSRIADAWNGQKGIFYFDNGAQALCEFFMDSGRVKVRSVNEGGCFDALHVFCEGDFLYAADRRTLDLLRYDFRAERLERISGPADGNFLKGSCFYDYHMVSGKRLWSFPNDFRQPVYSYDLQTGTFEKERSGSMCGQEETTRFSSGLGAEYWRAVYQTSRFEKYSLTDHKTEWFALSDPTVRLCAVYPDGEHLWMTLADSSAVVKCTRTGRILKLFDGDGRCGGDAYSRLYGIGHLIVGVPRFGDHVLFIDKEREEVHRLYLREVDAGFEADSSGSKILKCQRIGERIVFWGYGMHGAFATDLEGTGAHRLPFFYEREDLQRIVDTAVWREPVLTEGGMGDMEEFLSAVLRGRP